MWVGDTSSAIDVFTLTREGRQELKRQNPDAVTEPLTLTRERCSTNSSARSEPRVGNLR
jgi:hypothetical protein